MHAATELPTTFPLVSWTCGGCFVGHPRIVDHPEGGTIPVGENIILMCRANGTGSLVYSWERNSGSSWTTVSNDNTTSYTTDTTLAIGQYMYRCRVSNDAGSVVSNNVIVNVYGEYVIVIVDTSDQTFTGPPTITNPLIDQVRAFNESITLNCEATGNGTISYQWQEFNNSVWVDINNGNDPQYTIDRLTESSQFRCVVSNEAGKTNSTVTILVLGKCIA